MRWYLPDSPYSVCIEDLVGTDKCGTLFQGFCNEKPVEWIAVVAGQSCGALKGSLAQGQDFKSHRFNGSVEFLPEVVGKTQPAQSGLNREFPGGNGTDERSGVQALDEIRRSLGELGCSFQKPDHGIGVEQ